MSAEKPVVLNPLEEAERDLTPALAKVAKLRVEELQECALDGGPSEGPLGDLKEVVEFMHTSKQRMIGMSR